MFRNFGASYEEYPDSDEESRRYDVYAPLVDPVELHEEEQRVTFEDEDEYGKSPSPILSPLRGTSLQEKVLG